jgi:hypothetical protein
MNIKEANEIYKENGLVPDDIYEMKRTDKSTGKKIIIPVITRTGIEKIQATHNIKLSYEMISYDIDNVIIKATATMIGRSGADIKNSAILKAMGSITLLAESYGEASPRNLTVGSKNYPIAMAEKRAKSRAILQITGLYKHGYYGEDESEVFENAASSKQNAKSEKALKSTKK